MLGHVTSSYFGARIGRGFALALVGTLSVLAVIAFIGFKMLIRQMMMMPFKLKSGYLRGATLQVRGLCFGKELVERLASPEAETVSY